MSNIRFTTGYVLLALILGSPFAAKSGAIDVNGVCEAGSCPTVDALSNGQSISGGFNFTVTLGDNDEYSVVGSYSASYSTQDGSAIFVDPVVTYLGPDPSVAEDVITFDLYQNYFDTSCCTWAAEYTESVPLTLDAPANSTVSGQLKYDNISVGPVGPYGPGSYFVTQSTNLDFGYALDTADTLYADYNFVFDFAEGTTQGQNASSGVSALTPEPATIVLCGLALILFAYGVRRRSRFRSPGATVPEEN